MTDPLKLRAIDSHTGGEPTRVVIGGFPDIGDGSMSERLERFRNEYDQLRSAVVREPRGHDAMVGAVLCEPRDRTASAGVIFFNNVGYLGMCGHGTIGMMKTLEHLGRIETGIHQIATPVGSVEAELHTDGTVSLKNVPSYRHANDVTVDVPGFGEIRGDVAYGGNWFFLIGEHSLTIEFANLERLTEFTSAVRDALLRNKITGTGGAEIDHIELFSATPNADSRNFVLCPGRAYDRSPCGTGTSAKLACLYEDGKLKEGDTWRQESIVGSVFEGSVRIDDGKIIPTIRGTAHVTAEVQLILDETDPYRFGIT